MIYHILKPKSDATYCGVEPSKWDIKHSWRGDFNSVDLTICEKCKELRDKNAKQ
jgi:hypothetical protein